MARIVVSEFVSIDGVMEAPGGEPGYRHTNWVGRLQDPGQIQYKLEEVLAHEALLIGRITYESFAGAWPSYKGVFADRMNSMPKYVASTTLEDPVWNNTTVLKGDAMAAVAKLKRDLKGDMVVGGSRTLVNALKRHDLVDEYRLMVFPVVLGSGVRVFDETDDATSLKLVDTRPFDNGAVVLTYHVVRP
ncbi:MAG: dihydrofolate reductase [Mesorhizobium sp.]|nr:MAG: dihydrofolate reductase [Mesorhizobium sp.]